MLYRDVFASSFGSCEQPQLVARAHDAGAGVVVYTSRRPGIRRSAWACRPRHSAQRQSAVVWDVAEVEERKPRTVLADRFGTPPVPQSTRPVCSTTDAGCVPDMSLDSRGTPRRTAAPPAFSITSVEPLKLPTNMRATLKPDRVGTRGHVGRRRRWRGPRPGPGPAPDLLVGIGGWRASGPPPLSRTRRGSGRRSRRASAAWTPARCSERLARIAEPLSARAIRLRAGSGMRRKSRRTRRRQRDLSRLRHMPSFARFPRRYTRHVRRNEKISVPDGAAVARGRPPVSRSMRLDHAREEQTVEIRTRRGAGGVISSGVSCRDHVPPGLWWRGRPDRLTRAPQPGMNAISPLRRLDPAARSRM